MNIYWVTLDGDTIEIIRACGVCVGNDPPELDTADNYAGPFVTYEHARQFAADWADSLGFKPRVLV